MKMAAAIGWLKLYDSLFKIYFRSFKSASPDDATGRNWSEKFF